MDKENKLTEAKQPLNPILIIAVILVVGAVVLGVVLVTRKKKVKAAKSAEE